jgi:CRP-like cAMP-binding protein
MPRTDNVFQRIAGTAKTPRIRSALVPLFPSPSPVVARLSALAPIAKSGLRKLEALLAVTERRAAGTEFLAEGEALQKPRFLLSGWACRARVLPDGRRQILGFYLPGEAIAFRQSDIAASSWSGVALTAIELADASGVHDLVANCPSNTPGLATACQRAAVLEETYLLNQISRIGRQSAYERVVHLFLELYGRLNMAGLAARDQFHMPVTQEVLADALGLSIVHINRTLQQLRREKLIELRDSTVVLLEPKVLKAIADYKNPLAPVAAARRYA